MARLTRRRTLQLGSVTLGGAIAGCTALGDGDSETLTLGELHVDNLDFESHTVSVLFLDGENPVYWDTMDASPAESEEDDATDVAVAGGGIFEGYPTEVGNYVMYAWRDQQPRSEWEQFDFREHDGSCIGVEIKIGDITGSQPGDVSILFTQDTSNCHNEENGE